MKLFQAQVHTPLSDDYVEIADALMVVATAIADAPERQSASKAFIFSVTEDTVRIEAICREGRAVFALLRFDGERFTLASASPPGLRPSSGSVGGPEDSHGG